MCSLTTPTNLKHNVILQTKTTLQTRVNIKSINLKYNNEY